MNTITPDQQGCLKKREDFAVSLRKKKKQEILQVKRSRFIQDTDKSPSNAKIQQM